MPKFFKSIIVLLLFGVYTCYSQTWTNLNGGVNLTINPSSAGVSTMAIDTNNGILFVGGSFDQVAGSINCGGIAKWNGSQWDTLKDNVHSPGAASLEFINNTLYAGRAHVEKWNGLQWSPVGTGISWNGIQRDLCEYNGELYAGGDFTNADGSLAKYIAKWNGSSWTSVGTGFNDWVWTLCVYNGELYAGGMFDSAGIIPAGYIAKWNGTTWSAVGGGMNANVNTLCVYNGELYAGGNFTAAGGSPANYLAKWNGTTWTSIPGLNSGVNSLQEFNGKLILTGIFNTPSQQIAQCNGTTISAMANGAISGGSIAAAAMAVLSGNLYVGGFQILGVGIAPNSISCKNIAEYSLPAGIDPHQNTFGNLYISPNPFRSNATILLPDFNIWQYNLYSIDGRIVLKSVITGSRFEIERKDIENGLYFLEIYSSDKIFRQKILIDN